MNDELTTDEPGRSDSMRVSRGAEDARDGQKKPRNMSELEQGGGESSLGQAPGDPDGEVVMMGEGQTYQECARDHMNDSGLRLEDKMS